MSVMYGQNQNLLKKCVLCMEKSVPFKPGLGDCLEGFDEAIIVWQRFCEPARLRIAHYPWVCVFVCVCSVSCPPPQIDKDVTSQLASCV